MSALSEDEIKVGVGEALDLANEIRSGYGHKRLEVSAGAVQLLCLLIAFIDHDPSPRWALPVERERRDLMVGNYQKLALALIPKLGAEARYVHRDQVSAWEILHLLEARLSSLCFIPKDLE